MKFDTWDYPPRNMQSKFQVRYHDNTFVSICACRFLFTTQKFDVIEVN